MLFTVKVNNKWILGLILNTKQLLDENGRNLLELRQQVVLRWDESFFSLYLTAYFQHLSLIRAVTQNNKTAGQGNEEISEKLIDFSTFAQPWFVSAIITEQWLYGALTERSVGWAVCVGVCVAVLSVCAPSSSQSHWADVFFPFLSLAPMPGIFHLSFPLLHSFLCFLLMVDSSAASLFIVIVHSANQSRATHHSSSFGIVLAIE